jgi:hypothetical protein
MTKNYYYFYKEGLIRSSLPETVEKSVLMTLIY